MLKSMLLGLTALGLAGCASVDVAGYRDEQPVLDVATWFSGTVDGWGMVQDRSGQVVRRFYVRIEGRRDNDVLTLDEHFEFSDGTRQNRVWKLRKEGGRYTGTAGDVVGTGTGVQRGNAFNLQYVLALPIDGRTWHVDMDDWMYAIEGGTILNCTVMSKFGFRLGEVTLALRRR